MARKRQRVTVHARVDGTPNPYKAGQVCKAGEAVEVQPNHVNHMLAHGFTLAAPKAAEKKAPKKKASEPKGD